MFCTIRAKALTVEYSLHLRHSTLQILANSILRLDFQATDISYTLQHKLGLWLWKSLEFAKDRSIFGSLARLRELECSCSLMYRQPQVSWEVRATEFFRPRILIICVLPYWSSPYSDIRIKFSHVHGYSTILKLFVPSC